MVHLLLRECTPSQTFSIPTLRSSTRRIQLLQVHRSSSPIQRNHSQRSCTCTADYQDRKDKAGLPGSQRPAKLWHGISAAVVCDLARPLPSLAEQHSGLFAIADMDPKTASLIASILAPVLTISILLMICRIPLSWYPNLNVKKLPWIIAVAPTEPILAPTRRAIPPVGGVDIAPIIWVSVLTFVNEILLGPQGILNLLQRAADL